MFDKDFNYYQEEAVEASPYNAFLIEVGMFLNKPKPLETDAREEKWLNLRIK